MKLAVIIGKAVIGTAFCLPAPPLMAHVSGPGDVVQDFGRAWDASDAKAIGDLFAPDADFVAADGMFAKGRSSIEAYYAAAFADGFAGSERRRRDSPSASIDAGRRAYRRSFYDPGRT